VDILLYVLLGFFILMALFLVLMVLIQDEQGDGLAGMFGGGSASTFGSRAGNVLTRTTSILGALFLISAFFLAFLFKTPTTGDVAAAARQAGAGKTEWWNAQPTVAPVETPVPSATSTETTPATK
jgi:preprotein translocase subunit SecG